MSGVGRLLSMVRFDRAEPSFIIGRDRDRDRDRDYYRGILDGQALAKRLYRGYQQ